MPVTEYVTTHGILVDLDDYNELCAENERLRGAGQDVFGVVTACHALLDERGYAVGSEFHGDLRRRVEWLTDSCRRGPKLHIENGRLRGALRPFARIADIIPGRWDAFRPLWSLMDKELTVGDFRDARAALKGDE